MWGNRLGWSISAAIVVVAALLLYTLISAASISPPTDFSSPAHLALLRPPAPPAGAVDGTGPSSRPSTDAGDFYRQAIGFWAGDRDAARAWAMKPDGPPPASLQRVIDATGAAADMHLFDRDLPSLVNYRPDPPALEALKEMGDALSAAGLMHHARREDDDARTCFAAAFALGSRLLAERIVWDEYSAGIGLMSGQAQNLAQLEPDGSPRRQALLGYARDLLEFNQAQVVPVQTVLGGADPKYITENAGDVFEFARFAQEPMWRVEATLKLGWYKYNADRQGDQLGAVRYASKLTRDPDPRVAAAAKAALDLTEADYNKIR